MFSVVDVFDAMCCSQLQRSHLPRQPSHLCTWAMNDSAWHSLAHVSADASIFRDCILLPYTRSEPKQVKLRSQRTPAGAAWVANIAFQLICPQDKVCSSLMMETVSDYDDDCSAWRTCASNFK